MGRTKRADRRDWEEQSSRKKGKYKRSKNPITEYSEDLELKKDNKCEDKNEKR
jgi:hypothetical protein